MLSFKTTFINTYNQNNYNQDINAIDYSSIKCTCGSIGHFHNHATYDRYLILDTSNETITLTIQRIKCDSCNTTQALLPSFVIPYRILSNPIVIDVIKSFRDEKKSISLISKISKLSYECVKQLIQFYLKYHEQRLLSLLSSNESLSLDDDTFFSLFYFENKILFMQRILTKNHLLYLLPKIP